MRNCRWLPRGVLAVTVSSDALPCQSTPCCSDCLCCGPGTKWNGLRCVLDTDPDTEDPCTEYDALGERCLIPVCVEQSCCATGTVFDPVGPIRTRSDGCRCCRPETEGSNNCVPSLSEEQFLELCENTTALELLTDPGMVTVEIPDVFRGVLQNGRRIVQQPAAGGRLQPGEYEIAVRRDGGGGETVCVVQVTVSLDPDSGVLPEVEYISAGEDGESPLQGEVPSLQIGPLTDEVGGLVTATVFVDEIPLAGTDLNEAADIYAEPGMHVTTVEFTDAYGRISTFAASEYFEEIVTDLTTTYTTSEPETTTTTTTTTGATTTGVPSNCLCRLRKKKTDSEDCAPGKNPTGSGKENYKCNKQQLKKLAVEVTDRWGDPESHATSDSGFRTDEFKIICYRSSQGTVERVTNCKDCCPSPVIIITVDARIGALKVYAEDGTDRSRLSVKLEGSGIGDYSVNSAVATGFQSFELVNGVTIGVSAGVGASHKTGGSAEAGLTASTSTKTTYAGKSYGWSTSKAIPKKSITSWAKGACSKEHTLSVAFDTDMLADVDDWEQLFGITSDTSKALISKEANIVYSKTSFNCNSEVPEVGVLGGG